MWLLAWALACSAPPAAPSATPAATPVAATPAFRPRTAQERKWDEAAGIDPDKPLPAWHLEGGAPSPTPAPTRACTVGTAGRLERPTGAPIVVDPALPDADTIPVPSGRHQGERAVDVMVLTGGAAAIAVACDGQQLPIEASAPGRWLLVRTPQGWLKLVDLVANDRAPALKDVTIIKRR